MNTVDVKEVFATVQRINIKENLKKIILFTQSTVKVHFIHSKGTYLL